jgi:hypothetical protein
MISTIRPARLTAAVLFAGLGAFATTGFAQSTGTTAVPSNPSATTAVQPSKTESPDAAFKKLDPGPRATSARKTQRSSGIRRGLSTR